MKYIKSLCHSFLVLLACSLLFACSTTGSNDDFANIPDNFSQIALILPLEGQLQAQGKTIRDGFLAAYYPQARSSATAVKFYNSNAADIQSLYQQAIRDGAQLIIGPLQKNKVRRLARTTISVPVLALNYLPAGVSAPSGFFQLGISPENEAVQVAQGAYNDQHKQALIIYPQTRWASNVAKAFSLRWQQLGGTISDQYAYPIQGNLRYPIRDLLNVSQSNQRNQQLQSIINEKTNFVPQRRHDVDMIFLVASPQKAKQILPLLRYFYAGDIPVYSISTIYRGKQNPAFYQDMNGVRFTDIPWMFQTSQAMSVQNQLRKLWPKQYQNYVRFYALGLDAFKVSQQLKRLPTRPSLALNGSTGQLFLGRYGWIVQKFSWIQFKKGRAVLIS